MATDDKPEQVHDNGTETMSGDEVASAAAETLHGEQAQEEMYPQPAATVLPGGGSGTLIADEPPGEPRADRDPDVKRRNAGR